MGRATGFTPKTRALILQRDGGCVICGRADGSMQIHHRSPRQSGGSKASWINLPSNGVTLDLEHHTWVEKHRKEAEAMGLIVRRGILLPADIPVEHARYGTTYLTDTGTTNKYPPEERT